MPYYRKTSRLPFTEYAELCYILRDLALIADSFDQLTQIAKLADILCYPNKPEYEEIKNAIEKTCSHLRRLPSIGTLEVK